MMERPRPDNRYVGQILTREQRALTLSALFSVCNLQSSRYSG